MITGGTTHTGAPALAIHLEADENEVAEITAQRGIVSDDLGAAVAEMRAAGILRTKRPLYHAFCSPAGNNQDAQMASYWSGFEAEFGLAHHGMVEVRHTKNARVHAHRIYERVGPEGRMEHFRHDYARRERLARQVEQKFGQALTSGRYNRAVMATLIDLGDVPLATKLGHLPPVAPGQAPTPQERQIAERTGISKADVQAAVWAAWTGSDSGPALVAALASRGLAIAQGDRVAVVVDRNRTAWPLARVIGSASKASGVERVSASMLAERIAGLTLQPIDVAAGRLAELDTAIVSRPAPSPEATVPAPPRDRVVDGPPLHASGKIAFEKGKIEMDQITEIKPAEQNQKIRLVAAQNAALGEVDPPHLSPYEKQKRAAARREKHKASLLNKRYSSTVFQGDQLIKFIKEDATEGVLRISLRTGQTILDDGQKIELVGAIDEEAVKRCMQLCEAKNWQKINVNGPQEFKDLMWAEGQRRGVSIANHSPSAQAIRAYTLELEAKWRHESDAAPPPTTEADRARGRAADLEIKQQKSPAVRQSPTILDRPAQAVRLAATEGRHIDPARLRRQIETAKIRVTEAARLARIAISHAEYAAKKFKDVSNERDFEVRKEIKVTLDMKASKARNDVRDLKSKSRALLPWNWAAARQAQRDLPEARARAKAATAASDKYRAAGPLQPEFGPMYDKIWKDRERDTRSYRTARENADAARDRQRDAEASLAQEAEKLRELEAEAVNRAIDLEAPEREMVDDYDGPSYH